MTTGEKLRNLRRESGMTQEELADRLGVSRQAVSKWESDLAYPETEKILALCKLFSVSADELLFDGEQPRRESANADEGQTEPRDDGKGKLWGRIEHEGLRYEYISKARLFGIPVLHVNIGWGCRAHGIVAIGLLATGVFSFGLLAVGLLAFGLLPVGLLAFGSVAFGGAAFGGVAVGLLSFGGVAVGVMTFGGLSVGYFAVGGAAFGHFAIGDYAQGSLAIGISQAYGAHAYCVPEELAKLESYLFENHSHGFAELLLRIARNMR